MDRVRGHSNHSAWSIAIAGLLAFCITPMLAQAAHAEEAATLQVQSVTQEDVDRADQDAADALADYNDKKAGADAAEKAKNDAEAAAGTAQQNYESAKSDLDGDIEAAKSSAQFEYDDAVANQAQKQSEYDAAKAAADKAAADEASARQQAEAAKSAYDAAAASDSDAARLAELKSAKDAATKEYLAASKEYQTANSAYNKANSDLVAAANAYNTYYGDESNNNYVDRSWLNDGQYAYNVSMRDFFVFRGSGEATVYLNPAPEHPVAKYTDLTADGDATNVDSILQALRYLDRLNEIRRSEGLSELKVNDLMMANSMVNANYSAYAMRHSGIGAAECLAWNLNDPYTGWYDAEKEAWLDICAKAGVTNVNPYDSEGNLTKLAQDNWNVVGHYCVIMSPNSEYASCSINGRAGYTVEIMMSSMPGGMWGDDDHSSAAYSVAQYRADFLAWLNQQERKPPVGNTVIPTKEELMLRYQEAEKAFGEAMQARDAALQKFNQAKDAYMAACAAYDAAFDAAGDTVDTTELAALKRRSDAAAADWASAKERADAAAAALDAELAALGNAKVATASASSRLAAANKLSYASLQNGNSAFPTLAGKAASVKSLESAASRARNAATSAASAYAAAKRAADDAWADYEAALELANRLRWELGGQSGPVVVSPDAKGVYCFTNPEGRQIEFKTPNSTSDVTVTDHGRGVSAAESNNAATMTGNWQSLKSANRIVEAYTFSMSSDSASSTKSTLTYAVNAKYAGFTAWLFVEHDNGDVQIIEAVVSADGTAKFSGIKGLSNFTVVIEGEEQTQDAETPGVTSPEVDTRVDVADYSFIPMFGNSSERHNYYLLGLVGRGVSGDLPAGSFTYAVYEDVAHSVQADTSNLDPNTTYYVVVNGNGTATKGTYAGEFKTSYRIPGAGSSNKNDDSGNNNGDSNANNSDNTGSTGVSSGGAGNSNGGISNGGAGNSTSGSLIVGNAPAGGSVSERADEKAPDPQLDTTSGSANLSLATVNLSKTAFAYSGKGKKPKVTVVLDGVIVPASCYSVTYENNKNVGTATVVIEGRGEYAGSLRATFSIRPKGTKIKRAVQRGKGIRVSWGKQKQKMGKGRIGGYQICCTPKSHGGSSKAKTVKGYKKTSATIGKLSPKTRYSVKVRTYMKVGGKTYYSSWSAKKLVKTR